MEGLEVGGKRGDRGGEGGGVSGGGRGDLREAEADGLGQQVGVEGLRELDPGGGRYVRW